MRVRLGPVAAGIVGVTALVACAGSDDDGETGSDLDAAPSIAVSDAWYRPEVGDTWQWQLSGAVDTSFDVDMYDIDLFDVPIETIAELRDSGRAVICYFSAGSAEEWRDDVSAFADDDVGEPLDGWEGERWLDVRSAGVVEVMLARLDLAASKGCDGVEPDNVTAYRNDTGFDITESDQIVYVTALADAAHELGLSIGLKNGGELVEQLVDVVDFGVNEECHEYDECDQYLPFVEAGKPVFNAEYRQEWVDDADARADLCTAARELGLSTLVLPLELDGSFRHAC